MPAADEKPAVVVLGATGNQGSNVVKHLYAAGWCDIFAVTRNISDQRSQQLPQVFPGVTMLQGDFEDKESLAAAMRGPRAPGSKRRVLVFAMTTPCLASSGYAVDADKEILCGYAMIEACRETKVDHVVFSSVANCDRADAPSYHQSKHKVEEKLKKSGLPYTILRPVSFLEIWARLAQFRYALILSLFHPYTSSLLNPVRTSAMRASRAWSREMYSSSGWRSMTLVLQPRWHCSTTSMRARRWTYAAMSCQAQIFQSILYSSFMQ
jgi:nucleoside-diphosphate-sugar epimerase